MPGAWQHGGDPWNSISTVQSGVSLVGIVFSGKFFIVLEISGIRDALDAEQGALCWADSKFG